ncbi:MAG: hypothetical protein KIT81_16465 [Alphaproteobacteria bacterium]|nr:hypothetical protein [Alphaproteobacteria bacterium]
MAGSNANEYLGLQHRRDKLELGFADLWKLGRGSLVGPGAHVNMRGSGSTLARRVDISAVLAGMAWNTALVATLAVAYPLFIPIFIGMTIHIMTLVRIRQILRGKNAKVYMYSVGMIEARPVMPIVLQNYIWAMSKYFVIIITAFSIMFYYACVILLESYYAYEKLFICITVFCQQTIV